MNEADPLTCHFAEDMQKPLLRALASGQVALFTTRAAGKDTPNEDSLGFVAADGQRGAILVADGFGGQPAGDRASQLALDTVATAIEASLSSVGQLQPGILSGFDKANDAVCALGVGAATTLVVLEIDGAAIRPYHVGDSEVLVVGQRGRVKLRTISHSPVGYSVEAGVLDHEEALHHDERHVVSNMVGSQEMHIDVGPVVRLRPRDTVVVASDGLFDNLTVNETIDAVRKGNLLASTEQLVQLCHQRMNGETEGPSKPDDLTVAVFRPNSSKVSP